MKRPFDYEIMTTTMMMLMIGSNDDTREFKAEETASAGSVGLRQSSIAARNTASSPKDEEEQATNCYSEEIHWTWTMAWY